MRFFFCAQKNNHIVLFAIQMPMGSTQKHYVPLLLAGWISVEDKYMLILHWNWQIFWALEALALKQNKYIVKAQLCKDSLTMLYQNNVYGNPTEDKRKFIFNNAHFNLEVWCNLFDRTNISWWHTCFWTIAVSNNREQWLNGRVLDLRSRGYWFHLILCIALAQRRKFSYMTE